MDCAPCLSNYKMHNIHKPRTEANCLDYMHSNVQEKSAHHEYDWALSFGFLFLLFFLYSNPFFKVLHEQIFIIIAIQGFFERLTIMGCPFCEKLFHQIKLNIL